MEVTTMEDKPKKKWYHFELFSMRGKYGERMPSTEEVLKRNFKQMKKVQDSIKIESSSQK